MGFGESSAAAATVPLGGCHLPSNKWNVVACSCAAPQSAISLILDRHHISFLITTNNNIHSALSIYTENGMSFPKRCQCLCPTAAAAPVLFAFNLCSNLPTCAVCTAPVQGHRHQSGTFLPRIGLLAAQNAAWWCDLACRGGLLQQISIARHYDVV